MLLAKYNLTTKKLHGTATSSSASVVSKGLLPRTSTPCVMQEDPETLKGKLEDFLKKHGVAYKYSTTTKFANFVNKTLE